LDEGGAGKATESGGSDASYGRESDEWDGRRSGVFDDGGCEWADGKDSADLDGEGLTARTAGVVMSPTRKRVRTLRTATMNDRDILLVVPFLFFFPEKKLIMLQSRMKSSGCQLRDAQTWCRIVSLKDAHLELEGMSNS